MISLTAVALSICVLFALGIWTSSTEEISVPNVQGMTQTKAIQALENVGFKVEVQLTTATTGIKSGEVVKSDPVASSTAKRGSLILLLVSDVPKKEEQGNESSSNLPPWYPPEYSPYLDQLAYQWVSGASPPTCGSACRYFTLNVTSQHGCYNGLYVEMNFTSNGTVVDWSNDSIPSLQAGQIAQLQFITYDLNVDSGQLVTMNCH